MMEESTKNNIRIKELEIEAANIKKKYLLAKTESNRLRQHIEYLNEEMAKHKQVKNQIKALIKSVDRSLNARIDSLRNDKSKVYDGLISVPQNQQTAADLLILTRQTDFTVFYQLTHTKQIRYFLASGLYKFIRGTAKITIHSSLKTIRKIKRK